MILHLDDIIENVCWRWSELPEGQGYTEKFQAEHGEGAIACFIRDNDGHPIIAIITPRKVDGWNYKIQLTDGRSLCHGELKLELHKTLDSVIIAVVEAFKGPRTTPRAPHHA